LELGDPAYIRELKEQVTSLTEGNKRIEQENTILREEIRHLRAKLFGKKTEKLLHNQDDGQALLFNEAEEFCPVEDEEKPVEIKTYCDYAPIAQKYGVPLYRDRSGFDAHACFDWLRELSFDLIIVLGWYYMVPKRVRELAPLGTVGIHASLLPLYRGGAPLVWALINGEDRVGATLFYFSDGVDDGDIIGSFKVSVERKDTISTIYSKVTAGSIELLKEMIPKIANGTAPRIQQDESLATHFPQRSPEDGEIDWSKNALDIFNFVRAQTKPYPGAYTYFRGKKLTIWEARLYEHSTFLLNRNHTIGELAVSDDDPQGLIVYCGDHTPLIVDRLLYGTEEFIGSDFVKKFLIYNHS
jgi:methionyl-tRNA formyltransferase